MQDKRVREKRSKRKKEDMFGSSSHYSMSPPSHREIFTMFTHDLPQRDLHRGITTQHLDYTTPLSKIIISIQEGRHKAKAKKNVYNLVILLSQTLLMISKDHK